MKEREAENNEAQVNRKSEMSEDGMRNQCVRGHEE